MFLVIMCSVFYSMCSAFYSPELTPRAKNAFRCDFNLSHLDNVIQVDGVLYKGPRALQQAIQACDGMTVCVIDARNNSLGSQTFTVNPFTSPHTLNMPITICTGAYTVQWDVNDANAVTVDLPSNLTWVLDETTIRPNMTNVAIPITAFLQDTAGNNANDGGSGQGMLNARVYGCKGTIAAGSRILTVSDASNLKRGMTIAIVGGVGGMSGQQTRLKSAITPGSTQLTLVSAAGFPKPGSSNSILTEYNYTIVDDEIIGWNGIYESTLRNLSRGQFGTKITAHSEKALVSALGTLVTEVTDIKGSKVTLLDKSSLTLINTQIQAGAAHITIKGSGTISGNYLDRTTAPAGNVAVGGIFCYVCSYMKVGENIWFTNTQHAGVFVAGGRHNIISGHYRKIGRPSASGFGLGADILLVGNASRNIVRSSSHADGNYMVLIDDRSDDFDRLSGGSNDNKVEVGPQQGLEKYNSGVGVEGYSSKNSIAVGRISVIGTSSNAGLYVDATSQWPSATPIPTGNHFAFTTISSVGAAARTANYSSFTSSNLFEGGTILNGSICLSSTSDAISQNAKKETDR
jgi:hypothetical protein